MKPIVTTTGIALLLFMPLSITFATQIVELDLDGILGNGPDTLDIMTGDSVAVDIWWVGGDGLIGVSARLCIESNALAYNSFQNKALNWTHDQVTYPTNNCIQAGAALFCMYCEPQPWRQCRIIYNSLNPDGMECIHVNTDSSAYMDCIDFVGLPPDSSINAFVHIGATGTENTSWGSVKELFR